VGFDKQQFVFATAYETQHVWLPSPRLAYQKNLAGEKLSSANIGFTLLNLITFDVAYGLNNTVVDGKKVPRLMGFSFGFEEKF
jgi:hypothetical protein